MPIRPNDLENMAKEIEMIRKKYGMPKGMLFVPNKLEITLERKELDKFDLTYSEFFNYLPSHVKNMAIQGTIQLLHQLGTPLETITRMENGVKVQITGDFRVACFPITEILMQKKTVESEIKAIFDSISKNHQMLNILGDFHWSWNDETESKWKNSFKTLFKIIREHPSFPSELEAVVKKYTFKSK